MIKNVTDVFSIKYYSIIICTGILLLFNCSNKQKLEIEFSNKLQTLTNSMVNSEGEDPIHSSVAFVDVDKLKWNGASGVADGIEEKMTPFHKFKIASITKSFTATIILQLVEEDLLNLDDSIEKFLDNDIVKLDSLMIFEGKSYGRQIIVKQLLNHTSGIRDYMEDEQFIPDILQDPHKRYNPKFIMDLYYNYSMNYKTFFKPGDQYDYSDVNYVLLAMIIENVTGISYHRALRQRIFDPLKMENSYLEYYEESRGSAPLSHAFFSTFDLINDVSTSFDWGGGGIISTCEDLNTFFRALIDGKLFKDQKTLVLMIGEADKGHGGMDYDYGYGIQKRIIHGFTFYGHGGAYDCDAFYCPKEDISVVMSLNQMNTHGKRDEFLFNLIKYVADYRDSLK